MAVAYAAMGKAAADAAPTIINKVEAQKKRDQKIIMWVIIAIIGIFVIRKLFKSSFSWAPDAELTEYDEDTIEGVLNGNNELGYSLPPDRSPAIIELSGTEMTDAEIVAMTNTLMDRYSGIAASIANKLGSDVRGVLDTAVIDLMMTGDEGTVSTGRLDLYFRALEVWSGRFDSAMSSVTSGIAQIAAAQIEGINNATECTETILVKEVMESSTVTEDTYYQVTLENGSKGGFAGLFKKKSSKETRTTVTNFSRNDVRHIKYVPVCVDWQLDPTQLAGILAAGTLAIQMQYGLLTAVVNMAPKAAAFITPAE